MSDIVATDSEVCAREPIHIPGSIQPHGHLLGLEGPDLALIHASADAGALLREPLARSFGQPFDAIFSGRSAKPFAAELRSCSTERNPVQLGTVALASGDSFEAIAHGVDGMTILELEAVPAGDAGAAELLYNLLRLSTGRLHEAIGLAALLNIAAAEVRRITGFDRVLVYRFGSDWSGTVVAEDRNERLPSYMDHSFPESDIPAQARRLYALNRLRLIADAGYVPVPILPALHPRTKRPLDLSFSVLRSVSPIHVEYMRNMGTAASMSISLVQNERLWGLIACHNTEPRQVPFAARMACDLIGQVLSIRVAAREEAADAARRLRSKAIEGRLIGRMTQGQTVPTAGIASGPGFPDGLLQDSAELRSLVDADGVAILHQDICHRFGRVPAEAQIRDLAHWLAANRQEDVFSTPSLASWIPEAAAWGDTASGLLGITISTLSRGYILWFRVERIRDVTWSGNPRKPTEADPITNRLNPRTSFESWRETVRLQSRPWEAPSIEAARDFRSAVVGIVLREAEAMASLNQELERSNRDLAAFSYSVSHDLRAPFRHIVGYAELLRENTAAQLDPTSERFLNTIIDSAQSAGALVDSLLSFSRLGRSALATTQLDFGRIVAEAIHSLALDIGDRAIDWRIAELPSVLGDPAMLRQLWQNLLSNAVKYTRDRTTARIEIDWERREQELVFHVRDNGVGFDMSYAHKLFQVFQRLHRTEEFEGIGIGLANVRRIAERHGGRSWAEGILGEGAVFSFSLPNSSGMDAPK